MSRLPEFRFDDLDPAGQALWQDIVSSLGETLVTAEGTLAGPFNACVTAPEIGAPMAELGGRLRFATSVDRRLREVAIVTVGARWRAEFEWWAHARFARQEGISDEVLDALATGRMPEFTKDDERVVHAIASQLVTGGHLDQDTYDAGIVLLGDRGMVEIVTLCGYYTLVSFTLNAFDVDLPPGAEPVWADA